MTAPDLTMFYCEARRVRLTKAGCGRLFASTREEPPRPWEGRAACTACPIGAANAGLGTTPTELAATAWHPACTRCNVIGRRLVRKKLCVSCDMRDREARTGRNRKGTPPRITARIHPVAVTLVCEGKVRPLYAERAICAVELMVAAAKRATAPIYFGWSAPDGG